MPTAHDIAKTLPGFFTIENIRGQTLTLTVKGAAVEEVGEHKDEKSVISFKETPKKLVVNGTRSKQLIDNFGTDDLVGKQIRLYVDTVKVRNSMFEMICVGLPQ